MSYNPDVLHVEDFAKEAECYGNLEKKLHFVVGLLSLSERLAWGLKGFVFGMESQKAGNEWIGVGNWLGTDWSENSPWYKQWQAGYQALKAKGFTYFPRRKPTPSWGGMNRGNNLVLFLLLYVLNYSFLAYGTNRTIISSS